jgi:hypothetical protein
MELTLGETKSNSYATCKGCIVRYFSTDNGKKMMKKAQKKCPTKPGCKFCPGNSFEKGRKENRNVEPYFTNYCVLYHNLLLRDCSKLQLDEFAGGWGRAANLYQPLGCPIYTCFLVLRERVFFYGIAPQQPMLP